MINDLKSIFKEEIFLHLTLRQEELSLEAFRHYKRTVHLFDDYLYRINLSEKYIDESVVENWIKEISTDISINTIGGHIHYVRQLLLFLRNQGIYSFIPSTIASRETYVPYLYTDQDIEAIFREADSFSAPHTIKNKYIAYEMPLLLRLLLCCGLRVGETLNIKVGDIDFDRRLFILRVTKKYKQRLVPFGDELSDMLFRYCTAMGVLNDLEAYLFPEDNKYTPLKTNSVGNYYRIIRKRAGINNKQMKRNGRGACLHCFRHTFAVRSFGKNERNGIRAKDSVPFLSTYLGHDSLYETEKYLKYSGDCFDDTLAKFDAFAGDLFPEVDMDE